MLVLSRRINESIQIGTDVEVMVIDVRGDVVRLGITAPQATQIWRKELWDVIVAENRVAAEAAKRSAKVEGADETPQLPVSTFSRLSKIPTVRLRERDEE
ncbi:carbon storage regulator CsrA [Fretibacterium fastidiosum]|uniref:Translational regulator CsrA n=1 Tax=Fretibacterium fastidiosum TaxID=651822 RepID=A0AB94IV64_9BACT|nr:carbon storage regulator CsrA [Fretibacterium fastidiosum]CBL27633.1 carbon storage regulator (csrA) [Fretibacterium fastidiosum]